MSKASKFNNLDQNPARLCTVTSQDI